MLTKVAPKRTNYARPIEPLSDISGFLSNLPNILYKIVPTAHFKKDATLKLSSTYSIAS